MSNNHHTASIILTKEILIDKMLTNQKWLERGILAIYKRQTEDEKVAETTCHDNGRGFTGSDARRGSYFARWIMSGNHLSDKHLEKAKKMMPKYAGQLLRVIKENTV